MHQETITLTFGDCAENHRGMQAIGEMAKSGLGLDELQTTKAWYEGKGKVCELVDLREILPVEKKGEADPAYVLIVRDGCSALTDVVKLTAEQKALTWDSKAFMYGHVVNKKARHNLCYSDFSQEADYEAGKGTVVPFSDLPHLAEIRKKLGEITGKKLSDLQCEGNRYYDVKKTYIGFHGDTERRIVVAVRLGADFPIHYQWYQRSAPVGELFTTILKNGDIYYMSEKAVGFDWKKKVTLTLRHAAGLEKNVGVKSVPVPVPVKSVPVTVKSVPVTVKSVPVKSVKVPKKVVVLEDEEKIEVDKTSLLMIRAFTRALDGYARDYKENGYGEIPVEYIDSQVVSASAQTRESDDFKKAIAIKPDLKNWEKSWLRAFLFEYSTITRDYPMKD